MLTLLLALSISLGGCIDETKGTTVLPTYVATANPTIYAQSANISIPATNTPISTQVHPTATPHPTSTASALPQPTTEPIIDTSRFGNQGLLQFTVNGVNYSYPLSTVELNAAGQPVAPDGAEFAIIKTLVLLTIKALVEHLDCLLHITMKVVGLNLLIKDYLLDQK